MPAGLMEADTGIEISSELEEMVSRETTCECRPDWGRCTRVAEYIVLLTPHGCRRDGVSILMCSVHLRQFQGGMDCIECYHVQPTTVFVVSAREI